MLNIVLKQSWRNTSIFGATLFLPNLQKMWDFSSPTLSYFPLATHIKKTVHIENQRREELVVFILQRILGFSCLVWALYSYVGHYHQCFGRVHINYALSDMLFPEAPNSQDPAGSLWPAHSGQHVSCRHTAEEWQPLLAGAFMEQPQILWDLTLITFTQVWHWHRTRLQLKDEK